MDEVLNQTRLLTKELSQKMIHEGQMGKLISLSLRDTEFHSIVRSINLGTYTNSFPIMNQAIQNLVETYFEPVGYRHIGIHMGSIKNHEKVNQQPTIFEEVVPDTERILDTLNRQLQDKVFFKASDLLKKENSDE